MMMTGMVGWLLTLQEILDDFDNWKDDDDWSGWLVDDDDYNGYDGEDDGYWVGWFKPQ